MYISEASFSIRSPEGNSSMEWLSLFGQSSGNTGTDAYIIQDYIESSSLIIDLDKELDLRNHYINPDADFLSRLNIGSTQEYFVKYINSRVSVDFDRVSGILTLKVRAFSPEFSQKICRAILRKSEKLVNQMRERAIEDSLSLSQKEVLVAEKRLSDVRLRLRAFRQDNNLLDPLTQAGSLQGVVGELEGAAAKAKAELAEILSYMREDSSRVVSLKARIAAIEQQARLERLRLAGKGRDAVSSLAAEYETLTIEHEFAQQQFVSALGSLEAARIHAEGQSRYIVAFVQPTLPEEAMWPKRLYSIAIGIVTVLIFYGLGSLVVAAVREHAGV